MSYCHQVLTVATSIIMKALKCKSSVQFAYNYTVTINVLSKCSNIISHRSSVFEGRQNDHRSLKVGTSIIHLRRRHIYHRSSKVDTSIVDLRKSTHRSSKVGTSIIDLTSIFEDRRQKHRNDNPTSHQTFRQFVTEYCPQRCSTVICT